MVYLQHKSLNISTTPPIVNKHGRVGVSEFRITWKTELPAVTIISQTRTNILQRQRRILHCSSSSTEQVEELGRKWEEREGQFGNLANENGWRVRRMVEEEMEMRKIAQVQAQAFHLPVFLFDDLFFQFFQAEVLAGLLYKLRNSAPDRYACLVAEPNQDDAGDLQLELVGVVDVTVSREKDVLRHLPGAEEYLYVSGIAVSNNFRRRKVATALLKACDKLSTVWGFQYLVLRAYEDDQGARQLYTNAGYNVISGDPPWMTTWIGRKRRILMIKQSNLCDD